MSYGVPFGRLMLVAKLASGDLWVHSPAELSPALREEVDALGPVRFLIVPNAFHGHAAVGDWRAAYPDAELHAAPNFDARRKDLVVDRVLGDLPDPRWADDLDQATMLGHRFVPEVEFLHRASRTLVGGDLVVNVPEDISTPMRLWYGGGPGVIVPRLVRVDIRDRRQARASLDRLLAWDFDRLVPGHGSVVETGGREALRSAYAFL